MKKTKTKKAQCVLDIHNGHLRP